MPQASWAMLASFPGFTEEAVRVKPGYEARAMDRYIALESVCACVRACVCTWASVCLSVYVRTKSTHPCPTYMYNPSSDCYDMNDQQTRDRSL